MEKNKVFTMKVSKVYPLLVAKVEMNPNCGLIKRVVCGCRVEEIEDPLMQKIRYLDKLVDELAKGKTMEKILRK